MKFSLLNVVIVGMLGFTLVLKTNQYQVNKERNAAIARSQEIQSLISKHPKDKGIIESLSFGVITLKEMQTSKSPLIVGIVPAKGSATCLVDRYGSDAKKILQAFGVKVEDDEKLNSEECAYKVSGRY